MTWRFGDGYRVKSARCPTCGAVSEEGFGYLAYVRLGDKLRRRFGRHVVFCSMKCLTRFDRPKEDA